MNSKETGTGCIHKRQFLLLIASFSNTPFYYPTEKTVLFRNLICGQQRDLRSSSKIVSLLLPLFHHHSCFDDEKRGRFSFCAVLTQFRDTPRPCESVQTFGQRKVFQCLWDWFRIFPFAFKFVTFLFC